MMPDPATADATQLASYDSSIEKNSLGAHKAPIVSPSSKSVRWRYKHMGDKYLHKASLNKKQRQYFGANIMSSNHAHLIRMAD